jgi:hypothetical protein
MGQGVSLDVSLLKTWEGKSVEEFCTKFGKVGDKDNHCAHFVSHLLQLDRTAVSGAVLCTYNTRLGKNDKPGYCIRVNEIYNHCQKLEAPDESGCIAYITLKTNIHRDGKMFDNPTKHIGIYLAGVYWHYGNTLDKVRTYDSHAQWQNHYPDQKTVVKYTAFPAGAKAQSFTVF